MKVWPSKEVPLRLSSVLSVRNATRGMTRILSNHTSRRHDIVPASYQTKRRPRLTLDFSEASLTLQLQKCRRNEQKPYQEPANLNTQDSTCTQFDKNLPF